MPALADAAHGGADRAERRAPADDEQLGVAVGVVDLELGDVRGDAGHLLGAQADHQVVVVGVVRDRAGDVGLLEAADPVLEARRSPGSPTAGRASRGRGGTARTPRWPASANGVEMSGRAPTSGISQGSEPFARYASERR